MIRNIQAALFTLALATPSSAWSQDFPSDQFEPTSLAAAAQNLESEIVGDPNKQNFHPAPGDMHLEGPILRRRVQAIYTGQHRPIDAQAIAFYRRYEKAHGVEDSIAEHYREVFLFQENGIDYWLPVQDQVAAYFPKELKPGEPVELYLLVTGGYLRTDGWAWIFPVEEFRAGP